MIGKGGMATVYEAEQISLKRRVALKVLPGHMSLHDEAVKRFRREAEAGGRQSHPGIVAIFAVGEHEGSHYIAEELVEGETSLADLLEEYRQEKTLPLGYYQQGAGIIMEVAEALQHAHEAGVIHRDVKPSNVLVTPEGRPKVSDFGLAKVEDALALSRTGEFIGTPFYMSPEQAMSRRIGIDHRTDIYSLGVSLYELLTLKRPFDGKTSQEVLKKIIFFEPKNPSKLNPRVPRDLSTICMKAMEKNPLLRYQTMVELKEDLNRYLHGEVILARPAGAVARLGKWIKRHPAVSTVAGVMVVAALAIVLNWCWSLGQIVKERNKAAAINEFLETMLQSPDPDKEGRKVMVVDVLDRAAQEIMNAFPEQPGVEAALRSVLGNSYRALGLYSEAEAQQKARLELLEQAFGEESQETIRAKHDLATMIWYLGRNAEAEDLFREVLEVWQRELGEDNDLTLGAMSNLAVSLQHQDKIAEAEALYRQVRDADIRLFGRKDERTLIAMNNLAKTLMDQGKYDEAEEIFDEVLETRKKLLGEDNTSTLNCMINLATLYLYQGKIDKSLALHRIILKKQDEKLGDDHPTTLTTMSNLTDVLIHKKEYSDAETLCRKVVEGRRGKFDDSAISVLSVKNKLGHILVEQKKFQEARDVMEEAMPHVQKNLPKNHAVRIKAHALYGKCLAADKEYQRAEPHMLAYYEGVKAFEGMDDVTRKAAVEGLVEFYESWGKEKKVEEYSSILGELEQRLEE
jgi:tetratricopeptide (TPR) repeat protein/tRNA A-37 threonylcarbamoyl transferase component Bud32